MAVLTCVPCWGRDYKSAKAVREDWTAGRDFRICNAFSADDGKAISKAEADAAGITVNIRYKRLTQIRQIKPEKPGAVVRLYDKRAGGA